MMHIRAMTSPAELERLLHHMPAIAKGTTNEWATGFARSILRQAKRPGWRPSTKQLSMMRRLISDLFAHGTEEEGELILFED